MRTCFVFVSSKLVQVLLCNRICISCWSVGGEVLCNWNGDAMFVIHSFELSTLHTSVAGCCWTFVVVMLSLCISYCIVLQVSQVN